MRAGLSSRAQMSSPNSHTADPLLLDAGVGSGPPVAAGLTIQSASVLGRLDGGGGLKLPALCLAVLGCGEPVRLSLLRLW